MLGKNINRHLERYCKLAQAGDHISFRVPKHVSRVERTSAQPSLEQTRVSCPHCHTTLSNAGNLKRHLGSCKIFGNTYTSLLQSDEVLPRMDSQTAGISRVIPTTQHSPHSGSILCDTRVTSPGSQLGGDPATPFIHTPMTDVVHDMPCLNKHPKQHYPPVGTTQGKLKWSLIDAQVARELPHIFGVPLSQLSMDQAVDRLHVFIRTLFPPVPIIHRQEGKQRRRPLIPPSMREWQRQLRRAWAKRDSLPQEAVENLRTEYHVLRRHIRRRVRLANMQDDIVQRNKNVRKFREEPHRFADELLNKHYNHEPQFDKCTADRHFSNVYTDTNRSHTYTALHTLPSVPLPTSVFNCSPPTLYEIKGIIKKTRNKSAPGPSGIPYVAYKMLPSLIPTLHALFVRVWKAHDVPLAWRVAHMILLAKSSDATSPSNMRNIALGNSEGKLFFAVVAHRIQQYMTRNLYFDGITQKGFLPGSQVVWNTRL